MARDMRIGAWLFLASLLGIYGSVPLGHSFITLPTTISPAELADYYRHNSRGILLFSIVEPVGALLWMFYIPPIAVAMMRMANPSPFLVITHIITGSMAVLAPFTAGIFFAAAALHPDVNPELIQALHDIGKLFFLTSLPVLINCLAVAIAIYRDNPADPILPRWLAVINIANGVGGEAALIAPFFKAGPLGLNGVIGLYLPLVLVAVHIVGTGVAILRVPAKRWDPQTAPTV